MRRRAAGWILAAALLALAPARAAAAADLPAAKAFVAHLYGAYRGDGPDYLGRQRARVFSPRLIALLRRDAQLTPKGDVGALDGDPICDCQDFDLSRVRVDVAATGPGQARAVAGFVNLGKPVTVRLDLVTVRGRWRINNLHSESIPDLAAFLREHAGGR